MLIINKTESNKYKRGIQPTVKVINADTLSFQNTLIIKNLVDFDEESYVLRIVLNTLSINIPVELEPLKVTLE